MRAPIDSSTSSVPPQVVSPTHQLVERTKSLIQQKMAERVMSSIERLLEDRAKSRSWYGTKISSRKNTWGTFSLSLEDWSKNGETGDGLAFDHEHNYVHPFSFIHGRALMLMAFRLSKYRCCLVKTRRMRLGQSRSSSDSLLLVHYTNSPNKRRSIKNCWIVPI